MTRCSRVVPIVPPLTLTLSAIVEDLSMMTKLRLANCVPSLSLLRWLMRMVLMEVRESEQSKLLAIQSALKIL